MKNSKRISKVFFLSSGSDFMDSTTRGVSSGSLPSMNIWNMSYGTTGTRMFMVNLLMASGYCHIYLRQRGRW